MASADQESLIHKPEGSLVNPDLSKPLPTEVRVANNPQARKYGSDGTFKDMMKTAPAHTGAETSYKGVGLPHDAEYYEQWRKDTQGKLDKGEDYYADFARRARERSNQSSVTGKLVTGWKNKFGKDKKKDRTPSEAAPDEGADIGAEETTGSRSKVFGKKSEPLDVIR